MKTIAEPLHCLHVGGKAGETKEKALTHAEDTLEVSADSLQIDTVPTVGGNGNALVPSHRNNCRSIV
jgi:hypothetical protein